MFYYTLLSYGVACQERFFTLTLIKLSSLDLSLIKSFLNITRFSRTHFTLRNFFYLFRRTFERHYILAVKYLKLCNWLRTVSIVSEIHDYTHRIRFFSGDRTLSVKRDRIPTPGRRDEIGFTRVANVRNQSNVISADYTSCVRPKGESCVLRTQQLRGRHLVRRALREGTSRLPPSIIL